MSNSAKKVLAFFSQNKWLIIIFALSLVLNIINLSSNPVGLNQDESTNGYDAYSLGKTLHDYHGNFLPVMLESYGDWVSPLLTYLTIPFVLSMGLSNFSIRLPVAILGSLSVILFYEILSRLLKDKRTALVGSFIYALTPWLITFSRWAVPPSIVPFFGLLLLLSILKVVENSKEEVEKKAKGFNYFFNIILLGLSAALLTYTYPTLKLFVPMIFAATFLLYFKKFWKELLASGFIYTLLVSPMYILTILDPVKYNGRYNSVSIFTSDQNPVIGFFSRYLGYFSPYLYFGKGDFSMYHHVQGYPAVFEFLMPFFYLGLFLLILKSSFIKEEEELTSKSKLINYFSSILPFSKKIARLILIWVLLFPVAASITVDYFITNRVIQGLPIVMILIVFGMFGVFKVTQDYLSLNKVQIQSGLVSNAIACLIIIYGLLGITNFLSIYHFDYKEASKQSYHYGIKEGFDFLKDHENEFDEVLVDSRINTPDVLFHLQYDPNKLLNTPQESKYKQFGKYKIASTKEFTNSFLEVKFEVNDFPNKIKKNWLTVKVLKTRQWILIYNN